MQTEKLLLPRYIPSPKENGDTSIKKMSLVKCSKFLTHSQMQYFSQKLAAFSPLVDLDLETCLVNGCLGSQQTD
jgi:hypothetical protein